MTDFDNDGVNDSPALDQPAIRRALNLHLKPTGRERCFLVTLAVLGVCAAVLWRPIQQHWLTWLVLRAEAPAQSLVDGLVERDPRPSTLLSRLWETGRIPHRLAVLNYLWTHRISGSDLAFEETAILIDAARGGDLEAKQMAFTVLATRGHPEMRRLALEQLRDIDPAVRVVGLQQLARVNDSLLVPLIIPFLTDPDPRVVVAAGHALSRWTSNEFGIRVSQALPDFTREPVPNEDTAALSQGVERWMDWWQEHQADYAGPKIKVPASPPSWRLSIPHFSLEDLAGNQVPLSSLQGNTVLLTFWDTSATNSFSFLSELSEVQHRNSDRFVIVGISLDSTAPERDHAHEHEHEHAHGTKSVAQIDPKSIRAQLQQFVESHGVTYPVLIDATGDIGHRFSAFELPTNIIIDRSGQMCRRFTGPRSGTVVEAMLAEADEPLVKASSAHP